MRNQNILTPFFLDEPETELEILVQSDWLLNKPDLPEGDKQYRMSFLHRELADQVADTIQKGQRPVSLAGDCCTTIGVLAGLQRAGVDPLLIWFDAHGDFNNWETTPSGFLGGMPLAMLVGLGEQRMPEAVGLRSFPEKQVILTDGRDLDPGERILVDSSNVTHLPDVLDLLDYALPDQPLYIHFDVDVINPNDAPAMSYPAPGGPDAEQVASIFRSLASTGRLAAVSLSSWNPEMDEDGRTQDVCMKVFNSLFNDE